jgi:hypothetical protein
MKKILLSFLITCVPISLCAGIAVQYLEVDNTDEVNFIASLSSDDKYELSMFKSYDDGLTPSLKTFIYFYLDKENSEYNNSNKYKLNYYYGTVDKNNLYAAQEINFDEVSSRLVLNFSIEIRGLEDESYRIISFDLRPNFNNDIKTIIDSNFKEDNKIDGVKKFFQSSYIKNYIDNELQKKNFILYNGVSLTDDEINDGIFGLSDNDFELLDEQKLITENQINVEQFQNASADSLAGFFDFKNDIVFRYETYNELSSSDFKDWDLDYSAIDVTNKDIENYTLVEQSGDAKKILMENINKHFKSNLLLGDISINWRLPIEEDVPLYQQDIIDKEKNNEYHLTDFQPDDDGCVTYWVEISSVNTPTIIPDDGPGIHISFKIK